MNPKQRERLRAAAQQQTASQRKEKDRYCTLQKEVSDDMRDAIIKEELAKSISYVPTPKQKRKKAQIEKMADILVEEIKKSSARKMASPVTVYQQRLANETPRTTSDASTSSEGVPGRSAYLYAKSTSPKKPQDRNSLQWLFEQEGKRTPVSLAPTRQPTPVQVPVPQMKPLEAVDEDEEEDAPSALRGYTPTGQSKSQLLDYIAANKVVKADGKPYAASTRISRRSYVAPGGVKEAA